MRAILAQNCPALHAARIRARRWLGECICADRLARGYRLNVLFLLLLCAEIDDGQRADTRMRSVGHGETSARGDVFTDDHDRGLVRAHPAVGFGDIGHQKSHLAGLFQQVLAQLGLALVFELFLDRQNTLAVFPPHQPPRVSNHRVMLEESQHKDLLYFPSFFLHSTNYRPEHKDHPCCKAHQFFWGFLEPCNHLQHQRHHILNVHQHIPGPRRKEFYPHIQEFR